MYCQTAIWSRAKKRRKFSVYGTKPFFQYRKAFNHDSSLSKEYQSFMEECLSYRPIIKGGSGYGKYRPKIRFAPSCGFSSNIVPQPKFVWCLPVSLL